MPKKPTVQPSRVTGVHFYYSNTTTGYKSLTVKYLTPGGATIEIEMSQQDFAAIEADILARAQRTFVDNENAAQLEVDLVDQPRLNAPEQRARDADFDDEIPF